MNSSVSERERFYLNRGKDCFGPLTRVELAASLAGTGSSDDIWIYSISRERWLDEEEIREIIGNRDGTVAPQPNTGSVIYPDEEGDSGGDREKRRYIRISSFLETIVRREDSSERIPALTKELSSNGICIISDQKFEPGDRLELKVGLLGGKTMILSGEVRYSSGQELSKKFETGIELDLSPGEDRYRLKSFILKNIF